MSEPVPRSGRRGWTCRRSIGGEWIAASGSITLLVISKGLQFEPVPVGPSDVDENDVGLGMIPW